MAFMAIFDIQVVNVFIPDIQSGLSLDVADSGDVVSYYLIAELSIIPLFKIIINTFGFRGTLFYSSVLFTVFSVFCGLSSTIEQLLIFRVLQGVCGGVLMIFPYYLINEKLDENKKSAYLNSYLIVSCMGPLLSPFIGGVIVNVSNWSMVFIINLPFFLTVLLFSKMWEGVEKPNAKEISKYKVLSSLLIVTSLILMESTLSKGSELGWLSSTYFLTLLFVSLIFFALFTYSQLYQKARLMGYGILKNNEFFFSCIMQFFAGAAILIYMFLIPIMLSYVYKMSPLQVGAVFSLLAIPQVIFIVVMRKIDAAYYTLWLVAIGAGLFAYSIYSASLFFNGFNLTVFFYEQLSRAIAIPLLFIPLTVIAFKSVEAEFSNEASIIFNISRIIGGIAGVSFVSAKLDFFIHRNIAAQELHSYFYQSLETVENTKVFFDKEAFSGFDFLRVNDEQAFFLNELEAYKLALLELMNEVNFIFVIFTLFVLIAAFLKTYLYKKASDLIT